MLPNLVKCVNNKHKFIFSFKDGNLPEDTIEVIVSNGADTKMCNLTAMVHVKERAIFNCPDAITGNIVKVTRTTDNSSVLTLCEVEIYSFMAKCNGLH